MTRAVRAHANNALEPSLPPLPVYICRADSQRAPPTFVVALLPSSPASWVADLMSLVAVALSERYCCMHLKLDLNRHLLA